MVTEGTDAVVSTGAGWLGTGRGVDSTGLLGVTDGVVVAVSDCRDVASAEPDDDAPDCAAAGTGGLGSAATDGKSHERPMIVPDNTTAATAVEMLKTACRRRCGTRGAIGSTTEGRDDAIQ